MRSSSPRLALSLVRLLFASVLVAQAGVANADDPPESVPDARPWPGFDDVRVTVMAGLIQPALLHGWNAEVDVAYRRLVVGYSHGWSLDLRGAAVVGEPHRQSLEFHVPYTTGFGVGYRITSWLDVRGELKLHRFEVRDAASNDELFAYQTVTLGVGVYAQWHPFADFGVHVADWLDGFVLVGSVRYWPMLWTSLHDDVRRYENQTTGAEEVHRASQIGMAGTPVIVNVAVGYTFAF